VREGPDCHGGIFRRFAGGIGWIEGGAWVVGHAEGKMSAREEEIGGEEGLQPPLQRFSVSTAISLPFDSHSSTKLTYSFSNAPIISPLPNRST